MAAQQFPAASTSCVLYNRSLFTNSRLNAAEDLEMLQTLTRPINS